MAGGFFRGLVSGVVVGVIAVAGVSALSPVGTSDRPGETTGSTATTLGPEEARDEVQPSGLPRLKSDTEPARPALNP
jgi:hypothetical protein